MSRSHCLRVAALAFVLLAALGAPARASFHVMQIERVIGGVCGKVSQQAVQLRMRVLGQNLVSGARLRVWDAAGTNPVVIHDFTSNVAFSTAGSRVLSGSGDFDAQQNPALDFVLTNVIPASYLPAGRLTFESNAGTIYWSLSWGGAAYTGSTTGDLTNDADGIFGPSFPGPLPWTTGQALIFTGAFGDLSTNNAADYALTPAEAVFTNNAGNAGTVSNCLFGDGFETANTVAWSAAVP